MVLAWVHRNCRHVVSVCLDGAGDMRRSLRILRMVDSPAASPVSSSTWCPPAAAASIAYRTGSVSRTSGGKRSSATASAGPADRRSAALSPRSQSTMSIRQSAPSTSMPSTSAASASAAAGTHGSAQAHGTRSHSGPLPDGRSHPSAPVTARPAAYRACRTTIHAAVAADRTAPSTAAPTSATRSGWSPSVPTSTIQTGSSRGRLGSIPRAEVLEPPVDRQPHGELTGTARVEAGHVNTIRGRWG
jgi:hypothetical protein